MSVPHDQFESSGYFRPGCTGNAAGKHWRDEMKIKTTLSIVAVVGALVAVGAPASAAELSPPVESLPIGTEMSAEGIEPTSDKVVIDGEVTDIAVMPGFDPAAPAVVLDEIGQPVTVGEISVVSEGGETHQLAAVPSTNRAALASCWKGWVAPGTGTWYTSVPGCSVIGISADTTVGYDWTVDFNSLGTGCLQGKGYKARHLPGGGNVWDEYYGSLGCGGGGSSGGGVIKWGNVASTKQVQMMSASTPVGAAGMFQ